MFETVFDQAVTWLFGAGTGIFAALIILVIGLKLIKRVRKILDRTMEKAGVETTLRKFLNAFAKVLNIKPPQLFRQLFGFFEQLTLKIYLLLQLMEY